MSSASPQHRSTTLDPLQENPFSLLQATSGLHLPADQISSHQHDQRRPPGGFRAGQKAAAHNAPRPLPFGGSRSARRRPGKTYASNPLGGRITSEGFVRSASGSGAIVARSPYFLRSSSIGPNRRGGRSSSRVCTRRPAARRSRQDPALRKRQCLPAYGRRRKAFSFGTIRSERGSESRVTSLRNGC